MKNAKCTIKLLLSVLLTAVVLAVGSMSVALAEPDETYAIESYPSESETTASSSAVESLSTETQIVTEAPDPSESTSEQGGVTDPAETTQPQNTQTQPTYRAPLPMADNTEVIPPEVIGATEEKNEPNLFWGFVCWILIGVGLAVIFAVIVSTKTKVYRSGGRNRYSNTDKISGKKKLLSQEYYDKRKNK